MDIPNELRELVNVSIRLEDLGGGTIPRYALEARNSRWAMLKALGAEQLVLAKSVSALDDSN